MRVLKKFLAIFLLLSGIGLVVFSVFSKFFRKQLASLEVTSNLNLPIYVDGKEVGTTPYEGTFPPGEKSVKIGDYEANVAMFDGIKTVVVRNFDSKSKSFGETLSFKETGYSDALLSVVTDPGGGKISVDNNDYGITPLNINTLGEGKHLVNVSLNGYEPGSFDVNLVKGYKLTAFVDLKPLDNISDIETKADVFVKILETPNGFLRVRSEPATFSAEVTRVHEGEKYLRLDGNEKAGWFEIRIDATRSGWISDIYAATISATNN